MQKIFCDQTLLSVTHLKNLLEAAHINAEIRNEFAAGGVGELSFIDAWPELWVAYEDVALANTIIKEFNESQNGEDWLCVCGESNGSHFGSCWSCAVNKPS